ncbi:MAG: universal stress protein [Enterovirga sp.]|nr:universal stress protein [Enterovirga sp.]
MAFQDLLLQLSTYPEATKAAAVDQAVEIAEVLGARISALSFEIDMHVPNSVLGSLAIDIPGLVAAERAKSVNNSRALLRAFEDAATKRAVAHDHVVETCTVAEIPEIVTEHARMRDLTIIPVGSPSDFRQEVAEAVIFESGLPVLILPEVSDRTESVTLDAIGIAWDFSRPAARAVASAMPLLRRAKYVHVVTVRNEKVIETRRSGSELARHLGCHGIQVVLDEEDAAGRSIGETLEEYATTNGLDVLVMGAYGHSKLRDFVLGGATKGLLSNPRLPIFLSH